MAQLSFGDGEYAGKKKRTKREVFLAEMDAVVPWGPLVALIEPYYPVAGNGRRSYPLPVMLRVHLMQDWFWLSDPEMHRARKGNQWYFGMKAHIGADVDSGVVHIVTTTPAHHSEVGEVELLLHGKETVVHAGSGYTGAAAHAPRTKVDWQIVKRRSTVKKIAGPRQHERALALERRKEQVRARVEHPFRVVKHQFDYTKTRFKGLAKSTAQIVTLFALANLYLVRKRLMARAGVVRQQWG